jgi:hypothetical protein
MYGQYREERKSNEVPPPTHPLNGELRLVDATVRNSSDIVTEVYDAGDDTTSSRKSAGPTIDVKLHNTGVRPVLLTGAEINFRKVHELRPCFGAGELEFSAKYDVKVPRHVGAGSASHVLRHPMSFEVKENSYDRLAITVGPANWSDGEPPTIYETELTLVEDSGRHLNAGTFTLISPHESRQVIGTPAAITDSNAQQCVDENQKIVEQAVQSGGKQDPELLALRDAFKDPRAAERFDTPPVSNPATSAPGGCVNDKIGDVGYRNGATKIGAIDITKVCANFQADGLSLRVEFSAPTKQSLDKEIEVRLLAARDEYIVQSRVPGPNAEAGCIAKGPPPFSFECRGATVQWAAKGLTMNIIRRDLLQEPGLSLQISLFSKNRNEFGGYDGSDLAPDKSEFIVERQG